MTKLLGVFARFVESAPIERSDSLSLTEVVGLIAKCPALIRRSCG
jgi:hypothetical protein